MIETISWQERLDWDGVKLSLVIAILFSIGFKGNGKISDYKTRNGQYYMRKLHRSDIEIVILYSGTKEKKTSFSVRLGSEDGVAVTPQDLDMPWFLALLN